MVQATIPVTPTKPVPSYDEMKKLLQNFTDAMVDFNKAIDNCKSQPINLSINRRLG